MHVIIQSRGYTRVILYIRCIGSHIAYIRIPSWCYGWDGSLRVKCVKHHQAKFSLLLLVDAWKAGSPPEESRCDWLQKGGKNAIPDLIPVSLAFLATLTLATRNCTRKAGAGLGLAGD